MNCIKILLPFKAILEIVNQKGGKKIFQQKNIASESLFTISTIRIIDEN